DPSRRAGDRADATVPETEQMLHRLIGTRGVCGGYRGDAVVQRLERVDDHEAVALVLQPLELLARLLGKDDERAVGEAVHEPVDQRHLTVVLVAGRRENDAEVLLRERLRRPGEDGREVRGK